MKRILIEAWMFIKFYVVFWVLIFFAYLTIVSIIQAFKNPKLTNTERFLLIPENLLLQFDNN